MNTRSQHSRFKAIQLLIILFGMVSFFAQQAFALSSEDEKAVRRFEKVSEKMLAQPYFNPDIKYPFHVRFVDNPEVNANSKFVNGECWVTVNTGLWDQKKGLIQPNSDDEFAAALGHEMGHCLAQHQEMLRKTIIQLAKEMKAARQSGAKTTNPYWEILATSRDQENEADFIGMQLMLAAGYDPWAAFVIWMRAASREDDVNVPAFYRNHPSAAERTVRISEALEADNIPRRVKGKYKMMGQD
jgi:predicted Zn-dependent protease